MAASANVDGLEILEGDKGFAATDDAILAEYTS